LPSQATFKDMSTVKVEVKLRWPEAPLVESMKLYGKIAALVIRHSVPFRVGTMLFKREKGQEWSPPVSSLECLPMELDCHDINVPLDCHDINVPLDCHEINVPLDWVLRIEVDMHYSQKVTNQKEESLPVKASFEFNKGTVSPIKVLPEGTDFTVVVSVGNTSRHPATQESQVKVETETERIEKVVYTIGDVTSYTEFITEVRDILAAHPNPCDIFQENDLLKLCSTQKHPVLPKQNTKPGRWIHIELKVKDGTSATLVMRDDNLYVLAFINKNGETLYTIQEAGGIFVGMEAHSRWRTEDLHWGVKYSELLGSKSEAEKHLLDPEFIAQKLEKQGLGRCFAEEAVGKLSCYRKNQEDMEAAKVGLAGLIVIVCESARMNPIYNSIALGWTNNDVKFTRETLGRYVWNYSNMSRDLRIWKENKFAKPKPKRKAKENPSDYNYNDIIWRSRDASWNRIQDAHPAQKRLLMQNQKEAHPISQLNDVYLVLNQGVAVTNQSSSK